LLKQIDIDNIDITEHQIDKLDVVCNLISTERLTIKIAYMPGGIYHEKVGVFTDSNGDKVYFCGSNNATVQANIHNYESFHVTFSWFDQMGEIRDAESTFEKLWNNEIPQLEVVDFPEAVRNKLFDNYKRSDSLEDAIQKCIRSSSNIKSKKLLYDFQEAAIQQFFDRGGHSFYEMATGTGKTFTSIKTIEKLQDEVEDKLYTMILVPQIDLQKQWLDALQNEGFDNVYLMGGISENTDAAISDSIISYFNGKKNVICISVYDTFFDKVYRRCSNIANMFVVVDEAHNLNPQQLKKMPQSNYKLGLSATIQRHSKAETQQILDYFLLKGETPFYYGIEDAIEHKFLSQYEYYPIYVNLTQDEFDSYKVKTKAIASEMAKKEKERDLENLERLRRERSLIVKKANNKLLKLQEMTLCDYDFVNSVVYCGQGKVEEESIIDKVVKILNDSGLDISMFTSKTQNRPEVLYAFESGYYDTLVAIRCFDEGVDVPKLDKIYIMASDTSLRQTVQRRGRVLRKCAETNKTIAFIYDMIAIPPIFVSASEMGARSLVVNEFRRVLEYNRLANNKEYNDNQFRTIFNQYDITEEDFNDEEESN
jgi:superfamily II DNA or RNA helicase